MKIFRVTSALSVCDTLPQVKYHLEALPVLTYNCELRFEPRGGLPLRYAFGRNQHFLGLLAAYLLSSTFSSHCFDRKLFLYWRRFCEKHEFSQQTAEIQKGFLYLRKRRREVRVPRLDPGPQPGLEKK